MQQVIICECGHETVQINDTQWVCTECGKVYENDAPLPKSIDEQLKDYLNEKIDNYNLRIEENLTFLKEHPRTRKYTQIIQDNALMKESVKTLREVKMYIRVLEEEYYGRWL